MSRCSSSQSSTFPKEIDLYDVIAEFWEVIPGLNVNGGGWVDDGGRKADFGFTAKYVSGSNEPLGQLQFQSGDRTQNIKSSGFNWLVITSDDFALLEGMASINGTGGHSFRLIVADRATPGTNADSFALYIDGLLILDELLAGGNIKGR